MVFGGLLEKDALYLPVTPARNDGATIHELTVQGVPVDGFCQSTVYNAEVIWNRTNTTLIPLVG